MIRSCQANAARGKTIPSSTHIPRIALTLILALAIPGPARAQSHMIARQSNNVGMAVLPAPGKVVIDGDLADWDFSGRIWVFADVAVRSRYSVEAAAMWDRDNLYLAARWKDPTPMYNTVDPVADANWGWKSDSWQVRVRTADTIAHLTTWFYAPRKTPVLHITYGPNADKPFGGETIVLVADNGSALKVQSVEKKPETARDYLPAAGDAALAYRMDDDGKGFVQEMRIPWKLIYRQVPRIEPGLTIQIGNEFLWGDPSGKTWPIHRYADNMQPGQTSRIFYWDAYRVWGNATLMDKGNIALREYVAEGVRPPGVVPVRVNLPKRAARFALAINDEKGTRLRSLAGDFDPVDHKVDGKADAVTVEVLWDCLDDFGRLAPRGNYRVIGLWHEGIGSEYEMSYYNPGAPPWEVKDGTGGWGADHSAPSVVAASGQWVAIGWAGAEGGSGIIALSPDGKKKWGDKRGAAALAMDDNYLYAFAGDIWTGKAGISRFGKTDGSYKYFILDGKPRATFEVPLADIFAGKDKVPGNVTALAVHKDRLVLSMSGDQAGALAVLDATSAALLKTIPTPKAAAVAFSPDGKCYAILDGKLSAVDLDTGTSTPIPTATLGTPRAISVDPQGNIAVLDTGPDCQVKAYSRDGKLLYTCGKRGGRPLCGTFDRQGMMRMTSLAVDARGRAWVAECWDNPRRVSVWGNDGRLIRDYIGNSTYGGGACYLHDEDPTFAYWAAVEMKLDRQAMTYNVTRILWVPDETKGEAFPIPNGEPNAKIVTSSASGRRIAYLYHPGESYAGDKKTHVVHMERNGRFQPVAAILKDRFWNDSNRDGIVQPDEITSGGGPVGGWWGTRMGRDLSIYTDGVMRYRPVSFTDDGAPIYGPKGMQKLADDRGEYCPIDDENALIVSSSTRYGELSYIRSLDINTGTEKWRFPAPHYGVHGSHNAPMPKPGVIEGALKLLGAAPVNDHVGNVFAVRNNIGQDHFLTSDGLYISALFMDARLPSEPLPDREIPGYSMDNTTLGEEPFSGWFGRQADGKFRLIRTGGQTGMIVLIRGLDSIRKFTGPPLTIDDATLVKAEQMNAALAAQKAAPRQYLIKKLPKPPFLDGTSAGWQALPAIDITREGFPERAGARLAYDDQNLYIMFDVIDSSPWMNEGKDFTRLFKTGDAVDLHLGTDPKAPPSQVGPSHLRLLFSQLNGKPVCVLMKPVDKAAPADRAFKYHSPVGDKLFDRVEVLQDVKVAVRPQSARYILQAAIPLKTISLAPAPGLLIRGDLGFISSDANGKINVARTYWSNKTTNLTSDMPQESWLYPETWGHLEFE